jgi:hypothetical protein
MNRPNKNRLMLIAVVFVFAAPMIVAFLLSRSGWRPENSRNYGTLVEPVRDVGKTKVTLNNGSPLQWSDPQWHWTLLALPSDSCSTQCQTALGAVMRMRITLNRNAERLRVVYLGEPLPPNASDALMPMLMGMDDGNTFAEFRPKGDALALALVDPNGRLMLRHDGGFDVARVREDLMKVVH